MARAIAGNFIGPDGTALAGELTLTAKYNTPGASGLPKNSVFEITLSAGAYSDNIELGTYDVDWLPAGGTTVRLGEASVDSGASTDILTLIDQAVSPRSSVLPIAHGGTGASSAAGARTALGLGTIATQDADSVDIDGGSMDGTTIGGSTPAAGTFTTLTGSGDVAIDTDTLFVDASEDKVGVNLSTPSHQLVVYGTAPVFQLASPTSGVTSSDGATLALSGSDFYLDSRESGGNMIFRMDIGGQLTEAMRIDANGNVGVGEVPETDWDSIFSVIQTGLSSAFIGALADDQCQVLSNARWDGANWTRIITSDYGPLRMVLNNGQIDFDVGDVGVEDGVVAWSTAFTIDTDGITAAAGTFTTLDATGNVTLGDASTDTLNVGAGGIIKDASGRVGIGVTPESGWGAGHTALQVAGTGAIWGAKTPSDAGFFLLSENTYFDGAARKAIVTDADGASEIGLQAGILRVRVSGGAVTEDVSFEGSLITALTVSNAGIIDFDEVGVEWQAAQNTGTVNTQSGYVTVDIGGQTRYIPCYTGVT